MDPEIPLNDAVMVTDPVAFAVAKPPPVSPLLIVARFADDVLQCTVTVTS